MLWTTVTSQSLPINGIVSINLLIKIPTNILGLKKIDPALVPRKYDTDESLIGRVLASNYLDEII